MMTRVFYAVFFLCLSAFTTVAQRKAPGYMGRRLLVKYEQGLNWNIGRNAQALPNFFGNVQADWAIFDNTSVGVEYGVMYSQILNPRQYYIPMPGGGGNATIQNMLLNRVGVSLKKYPRKTGHFAPAGPYIVYGAYINVAHHWGWANNKKMQGTIGDFLPFVGFGKNYIVKKWTVLDVNVRVGVPLVSLIISQSPMGGLTGNTSDKRIFQRATRISNMTANIFEIRFGFGKLL